MEKTGKNIKDEFNERFKKVFEDIKKLKFLHRNVISADFKSGAFKIIFEDGVNSTDPDIQKSLHIAMDMLGEAGIVLSLRNVDHAARHGVIPKFKYDLSLFISTFDDLFYGR